MIKMRYNVKIGDKTFAVEIDDINKRPIMARVDGQEFEVHPETEAAGNETMSKTGQPVPGFERKPAAGGLHTGTNLTGKLMVAPLPGTVIEVFIKPGDPVEAGQVILVIEAMKMKNSIRSVRDGTIAAVHVTAGQTVAHKQTLLEFVE